MGEQIGEITHYFGKIGVAVIKLAGSLKKGDRIRIEGHGKEFEQSVDNMQVEHKEIDGANAGDEIGMKVIQPVKSGDKVFMAD